MSELKVATKFLHNTKHQQIIHVILEHSEVLDAYITGDEKHLIEELVDLQMSCETMLAVLGLDEKQRTYARKIVVAKNRRRGYYDDDNDEKARQK